MSDNQIRDLFQSAAQWLPDNTAAAGTDVGAGPGPSTAPATPATGGSNTPLPQLQHGSDVEIAGCVSQVLRQDHGEVNLFRGPRLVLLGIALARD
jgi:hypothetical protein